MPDQRDDLDAVKSAVAVLTACIVQTLRESDDTAQDRFLALLEKAYRKQRDLPGKNLHELEMLSWAREVITGFSVVDGQRKPFLED